jgi:hypothetical protein
MCRSRLDRENTGFETCVLNSCHRPIQREACLPSGNPWQCHSGDYQQQADHQHQFEQGESTSLRDGPLAV